MIGWCFPRTVKFKSPQNVFARRFLRVASVSWNQERFSWVVLWPSGKIAEIPGDHVIVFGKKVYITSQKGKKHG